MFDLLLVMTLIFMIFVAPVQPTISTRDIELPAVAPEGGTDPTKLMAVIPRRSGDTWLYEMSDGRRLAAGEIAGRARQGEWRVVIVASRDVSVQQFIDMAAPLRAERISPGLAVETPNAR
jgi:biopolymer transport protein ExbD